jgi:GNAT superfamily N-acetyltransferase
VGLLYNRDAIAQSKGLGGLIQFLTKTLIFILIQRKFFELKCFPLLLNTLQSSHNRQGIFHIKYAKIIPSFIHDWIEENALGITFKNSIGSPKAQQDVLRNCNTEIKLNKFKYFLVWFYINRIYLSKNNVVETILNHKVLKVYLLKLQRAENMLQLPDAHSPQLHLSHPVEKEMMAIWKATASVWKGMLTTPLYIKECADIWTALLAQNHTMTQWILVDKRYTPNKRLILASCETIRKRAWVKQQNGQILEVITHVVDSVYCYPAYRHRGYASRLLQEVARLLPIWQVSEKRCMASVLFSDVGKEFYAKLGWHPFPSYHIELTPYPLRTVQAIPIFENDVSALCQEDENMTRQSMEALISNKILFMIVPDHANMLWHHRKEELICQYLFKRRPIVKGAMSGKRGNRIWAIWARAFYGSLEDVNSGNSLYILRLVIENQDILMRYTKQNIKSLEDEKHYNMQVENLKTVLHAAQAEADHWKLQCVQLWNPTDQIQQLVDRTGIQYRKKYREQEGVCSLLWYGEGKGTSDHVEWICNEKYGYC